MVIKRTDSGIQNTGTNGVPHNVSSRPSFENPSSLGDAATNNKLWPSGKGHLNVCFLNGNQARQDAVKELVDEHYNSIPMSLKFKFESRHSQGALARSDIRVIFGDGLSSLIGTEAQLYPSKPTMVLNLDMVLSKNDPVPAEFRAYILHQFGHALGLVCSNNGKGNLTWAGQHFEYDPESIMNLAAKKGTTLSNRDKIMLLSLYPQIKEEESLSRDPAPIKANQNYTQQLPKAKPVRISGCTSTTVPGGNVYVSGNASVTVKGPGYVELRGNSSATIYGKSTVDVGGNCSATVHGDCDLTVRGNGSVRVYGNGTADVGGNGIAEFTGHYIGHAKGNGILRGF
ncbi:hypothetical protein GGS24DRAFT_476272 [Hypoxylon argillaceum]|nr:hypothetical protein GGS24DRAFT_476272 [Hypoxylon argillaceum]KAI1148128.1 hypothetical protein F4825DRAFT_434924 [Nemania diffusa]